MPKSHINSPASGEQYLNPAGNTPSPLPRLRSDSWHKKQRNFEETSWISDNIVSSPNENGGCHACSAQKPLNPDMLPPRSHLACAAENGSQSIPPKFHQPDVVLQPENWDVNRELGPTISRMSSDSGCISATSFSAAASRENSSNLVYVDNCRSSSSNPRDDSYGSVFVLNSLLDQPRPSYSSKKHSIITQRPYQFPPSQYLDISIVDAYQQDNQLWRGSGKQPSDSSTENDDSSNNWNSDSNDLTDNDDVGRFEGGCSSGTDFTKSSSKSTGTPGWHTTTSSVNSRSTSDATEALWNQRRSLQAKRATYSGFSSPTQRSYSAGRGGPATEGCLSTPYGTSSHTHTHTHDRRSSEREKERERGPTTVSLHLQL